MSIGILDEDAVEMTLVGKTAGDRDVSERGRRLRHHFFLFRDADGLLPCMRRDISRPRKPSFALPFLRRIARLLLSGALTVSTSNAKVVDAGQHGTSIAETTNDFRRTADVVEAFLDRDTARTECAALLDDWIGALLQLTAKIRLGVATEDMVATAIAKSS